MSLLESGYPDTGYHRACRNKTFLNRQQRSCQDGASETAAAAGVAAAAMRKQLLPSILCSCCHLKEIFLMICQERSLYSPTKLASSVRILIHWNENTLSMHVVRKAFTFKWSLILCKEENCPNDNIGCFFSLLFAHLSSSNILLHSILSLSPKSFLSA